MGFRLGNWKYLINHNYMKPTGLRGTNGNRGNQVISVLEESLFDLETDKGESKNLIGEEPEIYETLRNRMWVLHHQVEKEKRSPGVYTGPQPEKRSLW